MRTSLHSGSKTGTPNEFSSEISSSSGTKTPNLVARLMDLDLLPETNSPYSSSSSTHGISTSNPLSKKPSRLIRPQQVLQSRLRKSLDKDITGTRPLSETPRVSSARKSDVDHRFSLQINKENLRANEDLEFSPFSYLRRKEFREELKYSESVCLSVGVAFKVIKGTSMFSS
ncbi:hypothetical protein CJ030_MR1G023929 [Morella rubra]|uniref:DUF3741 domain-containing protein n=1 Tax=Morella rubra TaxID=262757 RepID=A0A6A1WLI0_9ROSI|nr:hypothetical protein CJ030_MR1G023929 [Morella rubra]